LALLVLLQAGIAHANVEDDARQCNGALRQRNWDSAIDLCTAAIERNRLYFGNYQDRGDAYRAKGQYDKAIEDYNRAIELSPNKNAPSLHGRGDALLRKGEVDAAIDNFTQAIETGKVEPAMFVDRASAYLRKGQADAALADYGRAIELAPRNAIAYRERGALFIRQGAFQKAIDDLSKAIVIDPKPRSYLLRGVAYDRIGLLDRAIEDYTRALEADPAYLPAYSNRGVALIAKGAYGEALADYDKALELDPRAVAARIGRGVTQFAMSRFGEAAVDFRRALQLSPYHAYAPLLLFVSLERAGRPGRSFLEGRPMSSERTKWPGPVYGVFIGDTTPEEAIDRALKDGTPEAQAELCEALFYAGQFYLLRGEKEKALEALRSSAATRIPGLNEYALAEAELGRLAAK
jgi:tetratricopeptide (TPR) repeat protein